VHGEELSPWGGGSHRLMGVPSVGPCRERRVAQGVWSGDDVAAFGSARHSVHLLGADAWFPRCLVRYA